MEDLSWKKRLLTYGIRVKRFTSIRDWSESRVIRVEGTRNGKPVVNYLKLSRQNRDSESIIYHFATHHPCFPAPGASAVKADGEEWLLLDSAEGTLLANIEGEDAPAAYVTAARRMARFHMQAAEDGWTTQISGLGALKERIETLPASVLRNLHWIAAKGEYSSLDPSLLSHVENSFGNSWPEFAQEYRSYPDSLIHGDCHYGNLFLTSEGGICLIDWGSASIAPGLMDLAALVDVTQRMNEQSINEPDVLNAYFTGLCQSEREAYGNPEKAWIVCRSVRAFLELEWFATTGDDYGRRVQRELKLLNGFLDV